VEEKARIAHDLYMSRAESTLALNLAGFLTSTRACGGSGAESSDSFSKDAQPMFPKPECQPHSFHRTVLTTTPFETLRDS
jgi:hypothetical protein